MTEFTKAEWLLVCREVKPDLTDEAYDVMWDEFQAKKRAGELND